jgi:hypothetical protein
MGTIEAPTQTTGHSSMFERVTWVKSVPRSARQQASSQLHPALYNSTGVTALGQTECEGNPSRVVSQAMTRATESAKYSHDR